MTRAINLNSKEWRDLVFANKNQLYGAYEIRRTSSKRHLMSLGIVILLVATFSVLPAVMKKLYPAKIIVVESPEKWKTVFADIPENDKKIIEAVKPVEPIPSMKPTIKLTPPVIKPDPEVDEKDEMLTQAALSSITASISTATVEGVVGGKTDIADVDKNITGNPSTNNIIEFAEVMPEPAGGMKELMSYLGKNIKYPIDAQENNIQGTVVLRFVVDKDGSIKDVTIFRPLYSSCDKEAARVVKSMPKWIPGRQNGNPVAVYFTLPVKFKLNN